MRDVERRLMKLEHEHQRRQALDQEIEALMAELPADEVERIIQEVEEECQRWKDVSIG
jgi:hypothetical protein